MRNGPLVLFITLIATAALAQGAGAGAGPSFDGGRIDNPRALPGFTLHDQHGRTVSLAGQQGKVVALTFLYTHCKDVCPLTAENLSQAVRMLGQAATRVRVLAVSVDPRGDTPASVRRFVRVHRLVPEFHYLTGTKGQLSQIWSSYGITALRRANGDINHTLYTVLTDRKGRGRVLYDATATPAHLAHDLRLLLSPAA